LVSSRTIVSNITLGLTVFLSFIQLFMCVSCINNQNSRAGVCLILGWFVRLVVVVLNIWIQARLY
jgi:hypothetical protein